MSLDRNTSSEVLENPAPDSAGLRVEKEDAKLASDPAADAVAVHIDSWKDGILTGWGWLPSMPEVRLSAEILLDGVCVAVVAMDSFRQDLLDAGVGDGRYSFTFELPIAALSGEVYCSMDVRVREYGIQFPEFPCQFPLDRTWAIFEGTVDSANSTEIAGWVRSRQSPASPVVVELTAGNVVLQQTTANRPRPGMGDSHCGFQFTAELLSVEELAALEVSPLLVRVLGSGAIVWQTPGLDGLSAFLDRLRASRYEAAVRVTRGFTVTGTIVDKLTPQTPVAFVITKEDGTEVIADRTSDSQRIVVNGAERILPCGFQVELAAILCDGFRHDLSLRAADKARTLFCRFEIDGTVAGVGFVEQVSLNCLSGWAFSYLHPGEAAPVDVWVGNRLLGSGNTGLLRPDVASSFDTSGFDGFSIVFHEPLTTRDRDKLVVRLRDSGTPLSFTPDAQRALEELHGLRSSDSSGAVLSFDGRVDRIDSYSASGWALNAAQPTHHTTVHLAIDKVVVASAVADALRIDVGRERGTDGRHGFSVGIPPGLGLTDTHEVTVLFSDMLTKIPSAVTTFNFDLPGLAHALPPPNTEAVNAPFLYKPVSNPVRHDEPRVALILLNRNGQTHLKNFLSSFHRHNTYRNYRIVVVDHGSFDQSQIICQEWATRLNITYIQRGRNDSFSASNNLAVEQCDEELILFVNNDIVLLNSVLNLLVPYFDSERVGAVGIKLRSSRSGRRAGADYGRAGFIQHLGVKFDFFRPQRAMLPYELPLHPSMESVEETTWSVPAVTAAAMMVRRADFLEVGGFDESYYYGYEDVDFCLTLRNQSKKEILCANNVCAVHSRGATRGQEEIGTRRLFERNGEILEERFGAALRQASRREALSGRPYLRIEPFRIAFAVSMTKMDGAQADFFTAYELGEQLARLYGWEVRYLPPSDWYNLGAFDAVVAMRHDFDPSRITVANPNLIVAGWARNWFDAWLKHPGLACFDSLWAASERAAQAFRDRVTVPVEVILLATNEERFQSGRFDESLASDYCFTGSYFEAPREIVRSLDPRQLPHSFAVFGHNWEKVPWFAPFVRGPIPYTSMPSVYSSTRIVIDDANSTVKPWGGINCRVYDALAAGKLVISNCDAGSDEVFGGLLPVYKSPTELTRLINFYLRDEGERVKLTEKLQASVLEQHTYRRRAQQVHECFQRIVSGLRYSVRLLQPSSSFVKRGAELLRHALRREGATVRADTSLPADGSRQVGDDVVLFVTGDEPPESIKWPRLDKSQINIRVHLGKPGSLWPAECARYDFRASAQARDNASADAAGTDSVVPLFDSAEQEDLFVQSRQSGRDLECGLRLDPAFQRYVPKLMRAASELNAQRTHVTATRRKTGTSNPLFSADRGALKGRADLVFFPDYRATNPYQLLLYQDLSDYFCTLPGDIGRALSLQAREKGSRPIVFHLHWTSVILGTTPFRAEAVARAESFLASLRLFIERGGRLCWTIHNVLPHEVMFPDIEIELRRSIASLSAVIHVHSARVPELAAPYYSLPGDKLVVASHGSYVGVYPDMTDTLAARKKLGIGLDSRVFLFLGQLRTYKGIDELMKAFTHVKQLNPNVHLIIGGRPFAFDTGPLSRWADETSGVTLALQHIPDDELQVYFHAADFVVLPYRKVLTSGAAHLALSFGLPIIAPDRGLFAEMLRENENGFLYSAEDPAGLSTAMFECAGIDRESIATQRAKILDNARRNRWEETRAKLSSALIADTTGQRVFVPASHGNKNCFVRSAVRARAPRLRVAAVVLHYAHIGDTLRCVSSLLSQNSAGAHIYIVSNDRNAESYALLALLVPGCTVIQAPDNLGYAGGNNLALGLPQIEDYDYVWLVNPDVVAPPDTLRKLMDLGDSYHDVSIFGAKIMFGDRPSKVWFGGGKIECEGGFEAKHLFIGCDAASVPPTPFVCDYVTGASLFFRRAVLKDVGLLPEEYFLYFEETHWCMSAASRGHRIMMFPEVNLYHYKRSEENGLMTLLYLYYFSRNLILMGQRFAPESAAKTMERLRIVADSWTRAISERAPERWKTACEAVERGMSDGLAGKFGKADLSDLILREQLDVAAATERRVGSAAAAQS
jgi:GT2 family glycosyltransferase/glycosyltransferase involved in cell wall biosynthesis